MCFCPLTCKETFSGSIVRTLFLICVQFIFLVWVTQKSAIEFYIFPEIQHCFADQLSKICTQEPTRHPSVFSSSSSPTIYLNYQTKGQSYLFHARKHNTVSLLWSVLIQWQPVMPFRDPVAQHRGQSNIGFQALSAYWARQSLSLSSCWCCWFEAGEEAAAPTWVMLSLLLICLLDWTSQGVQVSS